MTAFGIVLLVCGLALSTASWVAVLRLGRRPAENDEAWELARRQGFLISYPAAAFIAAGIFVLYFSGALGFLTR